MTWRVRQFAADALLFWFYRLRGRSYLEFYASKMDRVAASDPERATGEPNTRRFQLEYMEQHGLRPDARFLDYGCGTVAAGVHFIRYLQTACYVGADISAECIKVGQRRIRDNALLSKTPVLVHLPGGSMRPLAGRQFDIIWAQSVLTHLPPPAIEQLLRDLRALILPGGAFYATFAYDADGPVQRRIKDWYYTEAFFQEVAQRTGYRVEPMRDWQHPDSDRDRLLRFLTVK
jgi:SAM-dependent methyltransferase